MDPQFLSDWLRSLDDGWQRLAEAGLPDERAWKGALKAWLDCGQRLAERQQETQRQWSEAWLRRAGADSLLAFCRQCDEVCTEFARQSLLWQLEWSAGLRRQAGELAGSLLQARGEGDALLALNAAVQSGRQSWDEQLEALQQTLSELSPALAQNLQQWLTPPPENPPET
ncbi:hypothetical protein [Chromobacterium violaceum]|uniref:Uncharacterized protein n=2 Tax=Chromobacterium violaceum TaxID=536 RepID=Q7P040_CHRVO|nr:hypothetical protein [Chromobacterium violaceum]AAQ58404.1 hypothetical protein CV_0728 [Chromobacterium violaceum ATCC 12472]MBA8734074.1 hypothetical protein [Chromobacterium violaceum]OVE50546.1 hypothetical protein CBW21_00715 [Chromobacterium violaceum]SUX40018.1 Uncharacterised protein [Chromobacterium violaceum]